MTYTWADILCYLMLYSFVGWAIETCLIAIRDRRFANRGFLNLPLKPSCGVTAVVLLLELPSLGRNYVLQAILSVVVTGVVWLFSDLFSKGIGSSKMRREPENRAQKAQLAAALLIMAGAYFLLYLLVHPVVFGMMSFVPKLLVKIAAIVMALLTVADYICVRYALYTAHSQRLEAETKRLADRMAAGIWRRLEKAYPGIDKPQDLIDGPYTFAKGFCADKLVWVFLISSFLGALIETAYCWATGGGVINRSSVLYGPFSFVWGFGAVVLTVSLRRLSGREDRFVFLAGFVIGGAYEYFCSVFTELVFGTVFWDYSHMALNIGGRTNLVYCIFWGILAVIWVKILYPLMERGIERIPPLAGKILTWTIVLVMACNGLLTAAAMIRYTERQTVAAAEPGVIRRMLDVRYDDAYMDDRWPNMVLVQEESD